MKYILSIIVFLGLFSCKDKLIDEIISKPPPLVNRYFSFSKSEIKDSIYGEYRTPKYKFAGSILILYKSNFYEYREGGCTYSAVDSGFYKIMSDSIKFFSIAKSNDSISDNFNKVRHLKFALFRKNKIALGAKFNIEAQTLYKYKLGHNNFDILDQNGDGKTLKLDTLNRIIEEGTYRNFKLYDGEKILFPNEFDLVGQHQYFKNGVIDSSNN